MGKFTAKSESQILGSMAKKILAKTGVNDLNPGSILLTLLQAAARENFQQYYAMLQIIRNYNLDTTTGSDLDARAFEYGLTRRQPRASTGRTNILQAATFVKVATTFYTGFRSRISGDTVIYVNNAAGFPTTGASATLIIGRGTPNEEEINYVPSGTNPQNFTNYYQITLATPLVHDHALSESIVLKQGSDLTIPSGTVIQVPASGRSAAVTFTTTVDATLLAGDAEVDDVNVKCSQPGSVGNIGIQAINGTSAFTSPPFAGARAVNLSAFSNGQDRETDTSLRNRIKAYIQALSQSTTSGIKNSIDGLVDAATAKRVVSSNILLPTNSGLPVKIYIDDGTGFEPDFKAQGEEVITPGALGGEIRLQLENFPVVKAQLETLSPAPFDMSTDGLTLTVTVGNQGETLTFFQNQFTIPSAATAEEIVRAINGQTLLLEARTAGDGSYVVINAQVDANEYLQVTGGTANARLNFSTTQVKTFYLYKNDKLLSKDGQTAFIDSVSSEPYNFSGVDKTLTVVVDGKSVNTQTATIHQSDFASAGAASTATAAQVAALLNNQLAGVTASSVNGKLRLTSNTPLSANSKIQVTGGTANAVLGFSTSQVVGLNQDYTLNPELGVIELTAALAANDLVTTGTRNTRGFLTATLAQNYAFAGGETLKLVVDGGSTQTITFNAGTNQTATTVAAFVNTTLVGGTAVTRTRGLQTFLEVQTNTLDPTQGSIEILSSSTANAIFGFTADTVVPSILPHTAYQVSGSVGPYAFLEGDTLVIVLDNNSSGETFVITMSYAGSATSGASTTAFGATGLETIFPVNNSLANYWVVWKSGANTMSGSIASVANPTGTTFQYFFKNPAPTGFGNFAVGDQASFSGMNQASNNGNFLITSVVTVATVHAAVKTQTKSNPAGLILATGDRYLIGTAANTTINANTVIDLGIANPSSLTPISGDRHIVGDGASNILQPEVQGQYADSNNVAVQKINGYRYIVNGTGLNDWAGHDNQIATYNGVGTPGWLFSTANNLDVVLSGEDGLFYQYIAVSGTWGTNAWGGKAGQIAHWNGSVWDFTVPADQEVRTVTSLGLNHQYSQATNTWTENDWGGKGNQIGIWGGSSWTYETPATNDTVVITDITSTYQYNGTTWNPFSFWVEVANPAGVAETTTTAGSGLIGQRRQVSSYNSSTGGLVLGAGVTTTPSALDSFVIMPGDRTGVVSFFNNTKVTSLSTKAYVELVDQGTKVQLSSQANGSDGYVQVTGGSANTKLSYPTTVVPGLRAYSYYTGLIKLVHSTLYGDETNLEAFPGVGASGMKYQILAPTVYQVEFNINVRLAAGVSFSNVETELQTKIDAYVDSLGIGQEVIISNIVEILLGVQGIIDVQVITPSANVVVAQNELARTKPSVIAINVVT